MSELSVGYADILIDLLTDDELISEMEEAGEDLKEMAKRTRKVIADAIEEADHAA